MNTLVRSVGEHLLAKLPRRSSAGGALILAYHNVIDHAEPAGDRSLHLSLDAFERQLRALHAEADVVPLTTLLETAGSPGLRRRQVAVTFDDAYASAMDIGLAGGIL